MSTVTLTIDGRQVTVPAGTTLLHAAEEIGVQVPHYCYHPALSAPAQCRLCLVDVEGAPKPMPSCVTQAQDGQVVRTDAGLAREMRKGVLEFYLINHPLDCPICDQSGECKLQDYVHAEGRAHGRGVEPKRVFGRDDFGGDVLFYGDRCVMCTRCVRFMEEVAQDPVLTVVERGDRAVIDTFFEQGLSDSPYSGNIVDICPVGALVSKDFLHKARAWDLDHTSSVCPNCSQGCNMEVHTRDNVVHRLKPRENPEVNGHWMCDYGRGRYEWMNRRDRLDAPFVRGADGWTAPGWHEALAALRERLRGCRAPVRAVASANASNEDLGALQELVALLGGGDIVYRSLRALDEVPLPGFPVLTRRRDLAPNTRGADLLGMRRVGSDDATGGLDEVAATTGTVIVLGDELADQPHDFGAQAELYIYLGAHPAPAAQGAHFVLPVTAFAEQEGTFTNVQGRVQRFQPALRATGNAHPAWLILGALAAALSEEPAPASAPEAFARLAARVPEYEVLSYGEIGTLGALSGRHAALAGER